VHVLSAAANRYDVFISETVDLKDQGAAGMAIGAEPQVLFHVFASDEPLALHIDRYRPAMSFHDSLDLRRLSDGSVTVRSQHLQEDVIQDSAICVLSK
jgi:hypothetical protein